MLCTYVINSYVLDAINYYFYYLLRSKEEQAAVRKKDSVGARVFASGPHLVFMISQFYENFQSFFFTKVAMSFPSIDSRHHSTRGEGSPETLTIRWL